MSVAAHDTDELVAVWLDLLERGLRTTPEVLCAVAGKPGLQEQVEETLARIIRFEASCADIATPVAPFSANCRVTPGPVVGEGGYGIIVRARDEILDRDIAIKILRPEAQKPWLQDRFQNEAAIASQLDHPGVVPVYGTVVDRQGRTCFLMRLVQGCTLHDAIDFVQAGRLPHVEIDGVTLDDSAWEALGFPCRLDQLFDRFISVCDTLMYVHSRQVIHRDIKPNNIRLGAFGETVLLDWGSAKRLDEVELRIQHLPQQSLDDDSTVELQSRWTAPEVRENPRCADQRADVFALGATLYTLATGRRPAIPFDEAAVVPRRLRSIVAKATAENPGERYDSVRALRDDITAWRSNEKVAAHKEAGFEVIARVSRKRSLVISIASVIAAVLVTAACVIAYQTHLRNERSAELTADLLAMTDPNELFRARPTSLTEKFAGIGTRLDSRFADGVDKRAANIEKLRMSLNLTAFGVEQRDYLVEQTTSTTSDGELLTSFNQPMSLGLRPHKNAVTPLGVAYQEAEDDSVRFRIAALLASLGDYSAVDELVASTPDPTRCLEFMDYVTKYPVDFTGVEQHAEQWNPETQYAMSILFGKLASADLREGAQQSINTALDHLASDPSTPGVYAALSWALRERRQPAPALKPELQSIFRTSTNLTMNRIESGSYIRQDRLVHEGPRQRVSFPAPFFMSATEISVREYELALADKEFAKHKNAIRRPVGEWKNHMSLVGSPTPEHPVNGVTWYDCISFCNWLSIREGRQPCYRHTGRKRPHRVKHPTIAGEYVVESWEVVECDFTADGYRLPTEAEWEFAVKAGTETEYPTGPNVKFLNEYAVLSASSCEPVGLRPPNPNGLFNTSGNVREWTWDWHEDYKEEDVINPTGAREAVGVVKILKGGMWMFGEAYAQPWFRQVHGMIKYRDRTHGFRIVTNARLPVGPPQLETPEVYRLEAGPHEIEAESFHRQVQPAGAEWTTFADHTASKGRAVRVPVCTPADRPILEYKVFCEERTKYRVWVCGRANDGASNSYRIQGEGAASVRGRIEISGETWLWSGVTAGGKTMEPLMIILPKGESMLRLHVSEPNANIDKFLLVKDPRHRPK